MTTNNNGIFHLGQQRDQNALMAAIASLRPDEIAKMFMNDPVIAQYQRIVLIVCGGAGDFLDSVTQMLDLFPNLRGLFEILHLDFEMDPRRKRPEITGLHLGKLINGTVKEVLAEHGGIPDDPIFTPEARRIIKHYEDNFNHDYSKGAGAEPWLCRLAIHFIKNKIAGYFAKFLSRLHSQGVNNILPIVVTGAGGGTGMGMMEEIYLMALTLSKAIGIVGGSGAVKLVVGWNAYDGIIYDSTGQPTGTAQDIWTRCEQAWEDRIGHYYLTTNMGAHGLMATIYGIAESVKVVNNSVARGYTPAVIQVRQLTKAHKCRIGCEYIRRGVANEQNFWHLKQNQWFGFGKKTYTIELRLPTLVTVLDYARASYTLQRPRAMSALAATIANAKITVDQITNYQEAETQLANARSLINLMESKLLTASGMNGSFLRDSDTLVERHMLESHVDAILAGTDKVVLPKGDSIPSSFRGQLEYDLARMFGDADIRVEIATTGTQRNVPTFMTLTRKDKEEAEMQDLVARAAEMANRIR